MALTLKPGTVVRKLGMLSGLFTWAQKDCGWINSNPVHPVRKPRVNDRRNRIVTKDELAALTRAAATGKAQWLADALIVLKTSAMRRSELWRLPVDIELEGSTAHLAETKNGDSREVPLCPDALAALRRLRARALETGHRTLIPVASPHAISLTFRRTLVRARATYERECVNAQMQPLKTFLSDLRLHDFRHHAVSQWASTGALSVMELMAISGHKSPRMLARYTHLSATSLAAKLASISASSEAALGDVPRSGVSRQPE